MIAFKTISKKYNAVWFQLSSDIHHHGIDRREVVNCGVAVNQIERGVRQAGMFDVANRLMKSVPDAEVKSTFLRIIINDLFDVAFI